MAVNKIIGVTYSGVSKVQSVAVGNISKIDGVTAAGGGGGLDDADLWGADKSYPAEPDKGFTSQLFACMYGGNDGGRDMGYFRGGGGLIGVTSEQIYTDSGGSTALSLDAAGFFYRDNGGTIYVFQITTAGLVAG